MKGYFIKSTKVTPSVYYNPSKGILDMRGKSSSENPLSFYNHLYVSLEHFASSENTTLSLNAAFAYFNTSSSKCIYGLFKKLSALSKKGKKVSINWYFEKGDEDMREAGEDLSFMFDFEVKYVGIPQINVLGKEKEIFQAA